MSAPTCPACGGAVWCHRVVGLLSHHEAGCWIGQAEDVQMILDRDRAAIPSSLGGGHDGNGATCSFVRGVARAEAALLVAAGADEQLVRRSACRVAYVSPSVRARRFSLVILSSLPGMPSVDPRIVQ